MKSLLPELLAVKLDAAGPGVLLEMVPVIGSCACSQHTHTQGALDSSSVRQLALLTVHSMF